MNVVNLFHFSLMTSQAVALFVRKREVETKRERVVREGLTTSNTWAELMF